MEITHIKLSKTAITVAVLAALLASAAGCTRPYANFAVETTPAAGMMKSKTISTKLPDNASALAANTNNVVIAQLKREGFKYVPLGGKVTMQVDAWRGNKTVGQRVGYRLFHADVEEEYADVVTIELNAVENGRGIWDGSIEGLGEYLSGKYAPGCVRTLLDRYLTHESGEETCFRPDQM